MEDSYKINKKKEKDSKKRSRNEDEEMGNDQNIHKNFDKLDVDESDGYLSESDQDEEVLVDDNHDDASEEFMEDDMETEDKKPKQVNIWNPEEHKLKEDEQLDFDNQAYEMLHRARVEWPCMSIDFIVPENFNGPVVNFYNKKEHHIKDNYPYSCNLVAGSMTDKQNGYLYYMKWYNMHKTVYDDDPDRAAESDEEEGEEPYLKFERVQVKGNVNRLKTMKNSYLCGFWSDSPSVEIVDMRELINDLEESKENMKEHLEMGLTNKENNIGNKKRKLGAKNVTLKSFNRSLEGYGIEWSPIMPGVLAAGGQDKKIELYYPKDENCSDWVTMNNIYHESLKGHKGWVEDIIWSPLQQYVLASCSVDKSIRFWDLRKDMNNPPIVIENAHSSDVNCISWNNFCEFMIASGGDDGSFKVWDIRYISNGPISNIQWHKGAITALSWDPFEDSQIAVSSEDNNLSIWDFSVEPDDNQLFDSKNNPVPQQLLFLHQGQNNIKDLKFHPYYKDFLVSTAEDGINVMRPNFNDDESMDIDD